MVDGLLDFWVLVINNLEAFLSLFRVPEAVEVAHHGYHQPPRAVRRYLAPVFSSSSRKVLFFISWSLILTTSCPVSERIWDPKIAPESRDYRNYGHID